MYPTLPKVKLTAFPPLYIMSLKGGGGGGGGWKPIYYIFKFYEVCVKKEKKKVNGPLKSFI